MNRKSSGNKMLLRWSWREIWSGQLWPVLAALTLIIACVVALSALAIRVEKVMTDQSRTLIAADLVFRSANPPSSLMLDEAQQLGLLVSQQTRFSTMAFSDTDLQLVSVKAVDKRYPLRGDLELIDKQGERHTQVNPGELWLDERLFSLLNVKIGDQVAIGDAELIISGKIAVQPEVSFNPFRTQPNVFIHASDLTKSGAVQAGSRVRYRTFFNGQDGNLAQLQSDHTLQSDESWLSDQNESRTGKLFDKAKQYLSLTIMMVLLMASITLVLTCRHYAASRGQSVAMLKSMGASQLWLRKWLLSQVSIILISAFIIGSLLGLGLELLLRLPLSDILPENLPSYGWQPFVFAFSVALLIGLPALGIPLINLLRTPAISVLQAQSAPQGNTKSRWLIALPILSFIAFYGNTPQVWIVCLGLVLLFIILAGLSYGLLNILSKAKWGPAMALALSRIKRSPRDSIIQLAALSGSLMLIAVIWLVRTEMLGDWQKTLPANAPNAFALNIAPEQQLDYLKMLDDNHILRSQAYPIVRGRLTDINGVAVNDVAKENNTNPNILRREINFTWANRLPVENVVTEGQWMNVNGVSVERELAEELTIKVGDKLDFNVNGDSFSAVVNSLRDVEWQSMKPNFYFIFTPDIIANLPATWLVSFKIDDQQNALVNQLTRQYPTVSLLDFRTMAGKIQSLLTQITWSLTVLAGLGVLSGVLLIFTLLRLGLKQRQDEITLYRTLGASKKRISRTLWCEYGVMAVTAGLVAALGAEGIVFSLLKWGFSLTPSFHPGLWAVLPFLALLIIYFSLLSVIKQLLKPLR